jgi:hypothetical protein
LLPTSLRSEGKAILAEKDEKRRGKLAATLAEDSPDLATRFLVALADTDPSPLVRTEILDGIGPYPSETARRSLERHAASDPDTGVALAAIEQLRRRSVRDLRGLLDRRLARSETTGDADARRRIQEEEERWISIERGTMLPSFLRHPPAPLTVEAPRGAIHVLAFGDFGNGSEDQKRTADVMQGSHREHAFDFGLTLGDNFYETGMTGLADSRWKSQWEDLYGPLGIRFYPVLGNHDWKNPDSPAAEILYTGRSSSWDMPALYYTFVAGPAQFFAIDTEEMTARQLDWLRGELDRSQAAWKIVYGHHPIRSAGHHGDTAALVKYLLPVLRHRADVYLCGHDHDLQHLREEDGIHYFVAGGGGAKTREPHSDPRSLFARADHGFAVLDVDPSSLTVHFIGEDSHELYSSTIRKHD